MNCYYPAIENNLFQRPDQTMTSVLKTLLNFLSVVVLCTALAACAPSDKFEDKFMYSGSGSTGGVHSIIE